MNITYDQAAIAMAAAIKKAKALNVPVSIAVFPVAIV